MTTIGLGLGNLRFEPQQGDSGNYMVSVLASDGVYASERRSTFNVLTVTGAPSTPQGAGELVVSITPNPHYATAKLTFRTFQPGLVRAILYDMNGRRVRILEDRPMAPAGDHEFLIDGRDEAGRPLASGVYFFKVETSEGSRVGRAIMLK
ncbi:MAG: T9SS C-terminal target domain-containing protein [Acidobacteria bacterium]|nr:MAG: T9SS C-terminal target domain-containing protein [Acidobacteriota bacterium]